MQKTAITLGLALATSMTMAADDVGTDYYVRVQGSALFSLPTGAFAYNDDGSTSFDEIDLDELELDDFTVTPLLDVGIRLPILFDIYAGVVAFDASADATVSDPFDFGGTTFSGAVSADIGMVDMYAEFNWRMLNLDVGGVAVGLALHVLDSDMSVSNTTINESFDESLFMPALAVRVYANPLASLSLEARLHAIAVEIGDVDVTFYDLAGQVVYRPWNDTLGLVGGLRFINYEVDYDIDFDQAQIDWGIWGVYVGALLQF